MNKKFFGKKVVKFGFVAFALALGLTACGDGESSSGPLNNHEGANVSSVESEDDLPSCTESREGFVNFINGTKEGFVCKNRRWDHYDMIADIEENLPGCIGSREGLSAYLYEEDRELNCVEGSWDVVGEVASSSSSEKGDSSSSREKDGSSSSVAPNSSSGVILSDSEGSSSSSAKSSSSVASSSSVTSSSSVVSSSSTSVPGSSSSVIPGTDPESSSSSSEKDDSSSSVAPSSSSVILSSSSEESSSSVASSSLEESSSSVTSSSSVASSSSTSVPGSSSSVIPGTDPESPSEVKDDGYYKTNCPAGLDCKYATTTGYLNSTKTYGEVLDTRDGQVYKTIKICDDKNENCQTWMAQNLNYDPGDVSSMGSYAWSGCYGDESENCSKYGRLYTWAAAVDSVAIYKNYSEECGYGKSCTRFRATALATAPVRGVCPSGWHLPSNAEWSALYTNVGGTSYAGQKLKAYTSLWWNSNTGMDEYGFSVLPAGYRYHFGDFVDQGYYAYFWSSTEYEYRSHSAWLQSFHYSNDGVSQDYDGDKSNGFSVRCLKN